MEIYVVQQGDDIQLIATKFGITVEKLMSDNGLFNPYALVVGQALVILYPKETYTVKQGDTLTSIAEQTGISVMQLYRNNPFLYDREFIHPDENLVISYNTVKDLQVNGYIYLFNNTDTIIKSLPFLTFLSIYNYNIAKNVSITTYGDDTNIINLAKENNTVPLMMISALSQTGEGESDFLYQLLLSREHQERLIDEILQVLRSKGLMGINMLINKITQINQYYYYELFAKISKVLRDDGYIFMLTISMDFKSPIDLDFKVISFFVDRIIFMQDIWSIKEQPPAPITNISVIRPFIENVTSIVSSDKLSMGKPLIGYDWKLPFEPNTTEARLLSSNSVISLARELGGDIKFDEESQTPYFEYYNPFLMFPEKHIVWFTDARSIRALDKVIIEYDLVSTGLWHVTSYNQQLYSMINATFNIIKFPVY
jgi:spore germination protein